MSGAGGALVRSLQRERPAIRNTVGLLVLCLIAELIGAGLQSSGMPRIGAIVRDTAVLAIGIAVIRLAGLVLFRVAFPAIGISTSRIIEDIIVVAAYVAWGLLRLRLAGMDLASLVTTSAVITAVLAFAMQDTLGNVLGGLLLEIDRSIGIGDWMRIDDVSGRVAEIHWRHTVIMTRSNERVVIPNSTLMKTRFTIIGNPDKEPVRWRRTIHFDVEYGVPSNRVIAVAEEGMARAEIAGVAREPKPGCVLLDFGPSSNRYALRYFLTDPLADDATDSRVRLHLYAALQRADLALAFPQTMVHAIKPDERDAALRKREMERRESTLRRVDLFKPLEDAERRELAERLGYAPFAAGDVVIRQGAQAHWLYILVQGEAQVWLDTPNGGRRLIADLGAGDVFGEMGMMTGNPRRATVTAKTDLECYRLDKAGFADIIRSRPSIAEDLSRVLAERETRLVQVSDAANADATPRKTRSATLFTRISGYFGLDEGGPRG
jgi:small-conductance mechanosensitive channel/CRP-like cAMP-binding protein